SSHLHKMRDSSRRQGRMVGKSQARGHKKGMERKPPTSANRLRGSIPVPRPRPSHTDRGILEGNATPHRPRPSPIRGTVKPSHESYRENSQSRTRDLHPKPIQPSTKKNGTRDTPLLPGTRDRSSRMGIPLRRSPGRQFRYGQARSEGFSQTTSLLPTRESL